jgi:hypothetical protein
VVEAAGVAGVVQAAGELRERAESWHDAGR